MFDILAKDPKLRGLAAPSNLTMNQALDSHKGMNDDLQQTYVKHSYLVLESSFTHSMMTCHM